MSLFGNKFAINKSSPRKASSLSNLQNELETVQRVKEFGLDFDNIDLKLSDHELALSQGQWIQESKSNSSRMKELRKKNEELKDENNFLKLKIELLLDMLTEATVEVHLQEKDIEEMKLKRES